MRRTLLRRAPLVGALLGMLVMPQMVSAQIVTVNPGEPNPEVPATIAGIKPLPPVNGVTLGPSGLDPSRHIIVHITDRGFDKPSYTVVTTFGMNYKSDIGTVAFENDGTMVHTATLVPGSGYLPVALDSCHAAGGISTRHGVTSAHGTRSDCSLDTGGIAPGQTVVAAVEMSAGKIQFTSATDCMFGNSTPGFDCTPSTLTAKGGALSNILNSSMEGTILHNPDGSLSKVRTFNSTVGSSKKPLSGTATVTIDDEKGYDPTTLYITAGTVVTFLNKPDNSQVHQVRARTPPSPKVDKVNLLDSGGLGPGQSYSYTFDCATDPGCHNQGGYNAKFYSLVGTDLIPADQNGAGTNNGTDSRFMGRIVVIPAP